MNKFRYTPCFSSFNEMWLENMTRTLLPVSMSVFSMVMVQSCSIYALTQIHVKSCSSCAADTVCGDQPGTPVTNKLFWSRGVEPTKDGPGKVSKGRLPEIPHCLAPSCHLNLPFAYCRYCFQDKCTRLGPTHSLLIQLRRLHWCQIPYFCCFLDFCPPLLSQLSLTGFALWGSDSHSMD